MADSAPCDGHLAPHQVQACAAPPLTRVVASVRIAGRVPRFCLPTPSSIQNAPIQRKCVPNAEKEGRLGTRHLGVALVSLAAGIRPC